MALNVGLPGTKSIIIAEPPVPAAVLPPEPAAIVVPATPPTPAGGGCVTPPTPAGATLPLTPPVGIEPPMAAVPPPVPPALPSSSPPQAKNAALVTPSASINAAERTISPTSLQAVAPDLVVIDHGAQGILQAALYHNLAVDDGGRAGRDRAAGVE